MKMIIPFFVLCIYLSILLARHFGYEDLALFLVLVMVNCSLLATFSTLHGRSS